MGWWKVGGDDYVGPGGRWEGMLTRRRDPSLPMKGWSRGRCQPKVRGEWAPTKSVRDIQKRRMHVDVAVEREGAMWVSQGCQGLERYWVQRERRAKSRASKVDKHTSVHTSG